jgi:hypothetical protein
VNIGKKSPLLPASTRRSELPALGGSNNKAAVHKTGSALGSAGSAEKICSFNNRDRQIAESIEVTDDAAI